MYVLEFILKILAYGHRAYFYKPTNKFDFFLVIVSLIDLTFSNIDELKGIHFIKSFTQILLVLRVARIFKLLKSLNGV